MTSAYSIITNKSHLANALSKWQAATWADYLEYGDRPAQKELDYFSIKDIY